MTFGRSTLIALQHHRLERSSCVWPRWRYETKEASSHLAFAEPSRQPAGKFEPRLETSDYSQPMTTSTGEDIRQ